MSTPDPSRTLATDLGLEEPATETTSPPTPPAPVYRTGPAPFALVLGALGLLTAVLTALAVVVDLTVPWGDIGPWVVVAGGLLVLLVGAIGLRSSRTHP